MYLVKGKNLQKVTRYYKFELILQVSMPQRSNFIGCTQYSDTWLKEHSGLVQCHPCFHEMKACHSLGRKNLTHTYCSGLDSCHCITEHPYNLLNIY